MEKYRMRHAKYHILKATAMIVVAIIVALLTGCKTSDPVVVERISHDTIYRLQLSRDSIMVRDSIYITERMQGDTIILTRDRWHTAYRDRLLHDTTYISKCDTIPQVVEVEKRLNAWQRWWQDLGGILIFCAVILAAIAAHRFLSQR